MANLSNLGKAEETLIAALEFLDNDSDKKELEKGLLKIKQNKELLRDSLALLK